MVSIRVNERTPRSDFEMCPICTAKIPFSLAMHMVAAHSANAIESSVDSRSATFRDVQASAHGESQSKRLNHTGRGKSGFVRNRAERRH